MSSLSTHVLDTMHGCPAEGVAVRLVAGAALLWQGRTNADGRCSDLPALTPGRYRLEFGIADYYRGRGVDLPDPPFLDHVGLDFGIAVTEGAEPGSHYHVPLLVSPYAYSTYRGS